MSDDNTLRDTTILDTAIREPSLTATEVEMLFFALDRARAQFAWKVGGLDAAGLARRHRPSRTTLGGLVKHLAQVEDGYTARFLTGQPIGPPWNTVDGEDIWEWAYRTAADDSPEELYTLWQGAVARSRAAWAQVLATGGLEQPSAFAISADEYPNLRRVMVDTIEEYLRHTGQADLIREAVDGLVGNDPPQP
ncbi:MAG: DUF664 domain-containing protein [Jatrophihabitans sp.]